MRLENTDNLAILQSSKKAEAFLKLFKHYSFPDSMADSSKNCYIGFELWIFCKDLFVRGKFNIRDNLNRK